MNKKELKRQYTPRLSGACEEGSHDGCAYRWKREGVWHVCSCRHHTERKGVASKRRRLWYDDYTEADEVNGTIMGTMP